MGRGMCIYGDFKFQNLILSRDIWSCVDYICWDVKIIIGKFWNLRNALDSLTPASIKRHRPETGVWAATGKQRAVCLSCWPSYTVCCWILMCKHYLQCTLCSWNVIRCFCLKDDILFFHSTNNLRVDMLSRHLKSKNCHPWRDMYILFDSDNIPLKRHSTETNTILKVSLIKFLFYILILMFDSTHYAYLFEITSQFWNPYNFLLYNYWSLWLIMIITIFFLAQPDFLNKIQVSKAAFWRLFHSLYSAKRIMKWFIEDICRSFTEGFEKFALELRQLTQTSICIYLVRQFL
jgi:hypothetical protein